MKNSESEKATGGIRHQDKKSAKMSIERRVVGGKNGAKDSPPKLSFCFQLGHGIEVSERKLYEPSIINRVEGNCLGIINPKLRVQNVYRHQYTQMSYIFSERRDGHLMKPPLMS